MKKNCDICKCKLPNFSIPLGNQPLCDDLKIIRSNTRCRLYKIELKLCSECLTVNQLYKVKQEVLFPKDYNYRASLTKDVLNGMRDFVDSCEKLKINYKKKAVLDIGCNDGSLLDFFKKKGYQTFGIEPTGAWKDVKKMHNIYNSTLNMKILKKIFKKSPKLSLVTFTNVFAHIPDFDEVVKCLKYIKNHIEYIVIENHYLGAVLEKKQFDTFYQEHPRTYSLTSFVKLASLIGMKVAKVEFPKRYGGNIRVFLCKNDQKKHDKKIKALISKENLFRRKFSLLKKSINNWKKSKMYFFKSLAQNKIKVVGKAFPGRASIPINLLGLSEKNIPVIYEQDKSKKNYKYVPGTRIKILPDKLMVKNLKKDRNIIIINFAWHIEKEIKKYLKNLRIKNRVINIIQDSDFKIF
jgi:SAM-dependent methyltransferase